MPSRTYAWPTLTLLLGAFILLTAIPGQWLPRWLPGFMRNDLHLGLDLQGGTQLDFRISEAEIEKQIAQLEKEIEEFERARSTAGGDDAQSGDDRIALREVTPLPRAEIDDRKAQIGNLRFQRRNIVEAIRSVLERRVNALGVSEAVITPSYYGDEKHLLVECPGVVDIQQCIATIGKTILLEFKEQFQGGDEEHIASMRALAEKAHARITASGETLKTVGEDLGPTLGVTYAEEVAFFRPDLPEALAGLWGRTSDDPVVFAEVTLDPIPVNSDLIENRGVILAEITGGKRESERVFGNPIEAMEHLAASNDNLRLVRHEEEHPDNIDEGHRAALNMLDLNRDGISGSGPGADPLGPVIRVGTLTTAESGPGAKSILLVTDYRPEREEIAASHILIAYAEAVRADPSVTRTRDEARELIGELHRQLIEGAPFSRLAREHSDGPSAADGGNLGRFGRGEMTPAFEETAFSLGRGEISGPVETEFGFHLIRPDEELRVAPGSISYLELVASGDGIDALQKEAFEALRNRTVARTEEQIPLRTLFFSFIPTGWKDTPLDGKHFRRATVTTDPLTGLPVVQIVFDVEGGKLFHNLTKRNVGKPIAIFVGGELISAPVVQSEIPGGTAIITGSRTFDEANALAQDLNTGAIPAPVHLVGQSTVEATLGEAALRQSLRAAVIGFLLVGMYMIWYYRVLGLLAALTLFVYAVIFSTLLKLPLFLFTDQYVVLTLAGIAGIILSIGMAVDANVLIFERMKEELQKGKMLQTAADTGFRRAWTSIRDSNISTLLTAAILFIIGTSIVRGFAVTLSMGILISMFTAVVVTRFLIRMLYTSPIAQNPEAFGVRRMKDEIFERM